VKVSGKSEHLTFGLERETKLLSLWETVVRANWMIRNPFGANIADDFHGTNSFRAQQVEHPYSGMCCTCHSR
jgi:hypothetical protein